MSSIPPTSHHVTPSTAPRAQPVAAKTQSAATAAPQSAGKIGASTGQRGHKVDLTV
jgi:hypothetical protein